MWYFILQTDSTKGQGKRYFILQTDSIRGHGVWQFIIQTNSARRGTWCVSIHQRASVSSPFKPILMCYPIPTSTITHKKATLSKGVASPGTLTSCPSLQPNSSDTRLATDMAATRRGWVQPIFPLVVYPLSARYCVICVVLPEPVSPMTIRIWLSWTA